MISYLYFVENSDHKYWNWFNEVWTCDISSECLTHNFIQANDKFMATENSGLWQLDFSTKTYHFMSTRSDKTSLEKQVGGTHYKGMAIQPAEYNHKNNIGFLAGSAIKYISRYQNKNGAEDIKKAIHFLEMLLEMEYGEKC